MTANTAAAPTTSTGKSNSAKVTRLTITASRNLGRVGDNRSIRARRRAALARMTLTAINATPTASAAAKPRKASQTFQSPIESVIGAPAQSPPWWGTNERPCLGSGSPDRGVMHHLAQAPQEAPGGFEPVPCEQREPRRRRPGQCAVAAQTKAPPGRTGLVSSK
jgi:hypothetical protein